MKIITAEFVKSSTTLKDCPPPLIPEYAFIGRSNVGKSSLINALVGRKKLAKTSLTPGKTQCINHFIINQQYYFVDLPGYGYAKVSKKNRIHWQKFTTDYFKKRISLMHIFLLIDCRIPFQKLDYEVIHFFGEQRLPFDIIFTKADKVKLGSRKKYIVSFEEQLKDTWEELPNFVFTSSIKNKKEGLKDIYNRIKECNDLFFKSK